MQQGGLGKGQAQTSGILEPQVADSLACRRSSEAAWEQHDGQWVARSGPDVYACGGCSDAACAQFAEYGRSNSSFSGNETMRRRCRASPARPELFDCDSISEGANMSAVFFGSSHTRVEFFHVWRLLAQWYWPEDLPQNMTSEPAGGSKFFSQLLGDSSSMEGWQHGVLPICGGKASIMLFFSFKHEYWVQVDNLVLPVRLAEAGIGSPDYFVTEQNIWSMFPSMVKNRGHWNETEYVESELQYMRWVKDNFGQSRTHTLWLYGSSESPGHPDLRVAQADSFLARFNEVRQQNPSWSACAVSREAAARPPPTMVCAHGCDGPLPMVRAQMIIQEWNLFLKRLPAKAP